MQLVRGIAAVSNKVDVLSDVLCWARAVHHMWLYFNHPPPLNASTFQKALPVPHCQISCFAWDMSVLTTSYDHLWSVERMNETLLPNGGHIRTLWNILAHTMPHPWWWEVARASHQSSHPAIWAVSSRQVSISKELFKLMWLSSSPRLLWMPPSIGGDAENYKTFISTRSSYHKSRAGAGGLCPHSNPNFDAVLRDENAWVKQVRQDPVLVRYTLNSLDYLLDSVWFPDEIKHLIEVFGRLLQILRPVCSLTNVSTPAFPIWARAVLLQLQQSSGTDFMPLVARTLMDPWRYLMGQCSQNWLLLFFMTPVCLWYPRAFVEPYVGATVL